MESSAAAKTARVAHQLKLVTLAVMDSPQTLVNANVLECCQTVFVLAVPVASITRHKRPANRAACKLLIATVVII